MSCPQCGRPYGKRQRCYWCKGRKRTGEERLCLNCQAPVYRQRYMAEAGRNEGVFCSRSCKAASHSGVERVTGTRYVTRGGYVAIKTGIRKWQLEHRIVMERVLRRKLHKHEHVHHRNGNKTDNRRRNLVLLTNAEHWAVHHQK